MSLGSNSGQKAEINMTPMIDVLLVLIIIFLVITPLAPTGLNASIPQSAAPGRTTDAPRHDIVITVLADHTVQLNQEPIDLPQLQERLIALFRNGGNRVVFVRGEKDLKFGQIAGVIDIAKGAGVERVGLMTQ
jgi:biopolymer transport protein ExbD